MLGEAWPSSSHDLVNITLVWEGSMKISQTGNCHNLSSIVESLPFGEAILYHLKNYYVNEMRNATVLYKGNLLCRSSLEINYKINKSIPSFKRELSRAIGL
jgi:hypothetical protein